MLGNYLNIEKCGEVLEITKKREFFKVTDV